jgi:hypothetical protein
MFEGVLCSSRRSRGTRARKRERERDRGRERASGKRERAMEDSHSTGQQEPPSNQELENPETQQQQQQQQEKQEKQLKQIIHPTQSLPPPLRTIRRSFELLSVSYFLNIFAPFLSIEDWSISVSLIPPKHPSTAHHKTSLSVSTHSNSKIPLPP